MNSDRAMIYAFHLYAVLCLGSMATMSISVAFLIFCIVVLGGGPKVFVKEFREILKDVVIRRFFWIAVLLTLACAVSLILGGLYPLEYFGKVAHVQFFSKMSKAWYLFLPFIILVGLRRISPGDRQKILKTWVIAFAVLSLIGWFQHYTGWPRRQQIPFLSVERFHTTVFLGHHLSLASIFIFPFFAVLDFIKNGWVLRRKVLLMIALLGLVALFMSYSRALWGALPVGIGIWLVLGLPRKWGISLALVFVAILIGSIQLPAVKERIHHQFGISDRVNLWKANLEFFQQRPLFGVGWRSNQELSGYYLLEKTKNETVFSGHAHNNFLEMLGGTGIIGTLLWLIWCLMIFWLLYQVYRVPLKGAFPLGMICAWIVFHINGLTQVNFWEGKVMHQMMWVTAWILLWWNQAKEQRLLPR